MHPVQVHPSHVPTVSSSWPCLCDPRALGSTLYTLKSHIQLYMCAECMRKPLGLGCQLQLYFNTGKAKCLANLHETGINIFQSEELYRVTPDKFQVIVLDYTSKAITITLQ